MGEPFKLKNGTVLVSTEAPGGIYNAAQLKKIAELCSKELAIVKATEDQRLALFVKESEVQNVVQQLKAMGLGFRNYQDGLHQPVSCLGELCEEHEQPALASATELTKILGAIQLQSPLKIGINGCARCCAPCQTLDIAIIGEAGGYRISLGGKTSQVPEFATFFAEGVPAKELPRLVKKIVDLFQANAEAGESLQDVLERCGVNGFVDALAPYSQDAAGRDDPFAAGGDEPAVDDDESMAAADDDAMASADDDVMADDAAMIASDDDVMADDAAMIASDDDVMADDAAMIASDDDVMADDAAMIASDDDVMADDAAMIASDDDVMADDDAVLAADKGLSIDDMEDGPMEIEVEGGDEDLALASDDIAIDSGDVDFANDDIVIESDDSTMDQDDIAVDDEAMAMDAADDEIAIEEEPAEANLLADDDLGLDDDEISIEDDTEGEAMDEIRAQADDEIALDDDVSLSEVSSDLTDDVATTDDDISLEMADELSEELPEEEEAFSFEEETLEADDSEPVEASEAVSDEEKFEADESLELDEIEEVTDEELAAEESFESGEEKPELDAGLVSSSDVALVDDDELTIEDEAEAAGSSLMSDEEESKFEENLQASIEEEKKLQEVLPIDTNLQQREAALNLLENAADDDLTDDGESDLEIVLDDEAEMVAVEAPKAVPTPVSVPKAAVSPAPTPMKAPAAKPAAKGMDLAGVDLNGQTLRVEFLSGAYVDIDLSTLAEGESRPFRFGKKSVVVVHEADGYAVEIDGMKMFYPLESLPAA